MTFGFMQSSKNSSRFYYVPGLISLILIPILGLIVINHRKKNLYEHCIEIAVFDKDTTYFSRSILPERCYHTRYLTGDRKADLETLQEINNISNNYYKYSNIKDALKIVFQDSAKYDSFIKLIDFCKKNKIVRYYIVDNEFILFFDYLDLPIGDVVIKAKYLDHDLRLIEDEDNEYEIKIKLKPYHGFCDVLIDNKEMIRLVNQQEKEIMQTLLLDFINQRRILFVLTCVLYIILFYLAIRKIIK